MSAYVPLQHCPHVSTERAQEEERGVGRPLSRHGGGQKCVKVTCQEPDKECHQRQVGIERRNGKPGFHLIGGLRQDGRPGCNWIGGLRDGMVCQAIWWIEGWNGMPGL